MAIREINVLIGSSEASYTRTVKRIIKHLFGQASVELVVSSQLDDLPLHAIWKKFDLAVIFPENLLTSAGANPGRIERVVSVLPALKSGSVRRLIALSAHCPGPDFPDQVRRAGANYFLRLPYNLAEFEAALAVCR
jgi:hypothetical protein